MRTLSSVVATCVALHAVGCVGSGSVVELVLPKGFKGEIRIVLDPNGEQVSSDGARTTYRIPESGVVRVRSLSPLTEWHSLVATFDDGQNLPLAVSRSDSRATNDRSQLYLWDGVARVADDLTEITCFAGTAEEYDDWASQQ